MNSTLYELSDSHIIAKTGLFVKEIFLKFPHFLTALKSPGGCAAVDGTQRHVQNAETQKSFPRHCQSFLWTDAFSHSSFDE